MTPGVLLIKLADHMRLVPNSDFFCPEIQVYHDCKPFLLLGLGEACLDFDCSLFAGILVAEILCT